MIRHRLGPNPDVNLSRSLLRELCAAPDSDRESRMRSCDCSQRVASSSCVLDNGYKLCSI